MGKGSYKKLKGSQNFRQRLILATLSATPIIIKGIRANDMLPGLRLHEVSLLRLLEKISDDCVVKINETGTMVQYKPGILMGGRHLVHDCGEIRAIGYFLEPLLVLGLFSKNPLSIRLKEGLELKIESRGAPPHGGGEVLLSIPNIQSLTAVTWIDEGMVKRIRGVTFSTRVSSQFENTMIHSARGIFNHLLPDVHIFTDHKAGPQAGNSPGYGISLVAETTSGCFISANTAVSYARAEDGGMEDEKGELMPPEDVGEQIASVLLQEIEQGGVVDTTHQGLLFLLCALCPQDVSKIRVGKLIPHGIEVLKLIRDFLGVKFVIKPDPSTGTVILKCVGSGLKNLSRKSS
ncbi:RNA 3'-terminal phosphate cyclase-like protein [Populus alba x Populus x berolinensis]|uniref:RNA 3'-terminal phosphate cyclase-like protein n=1 Tax=Populus alba x Populus x berolinensis TaxID=444605 RepID=A0AAD6RPC6_9ROSI|nr:RNA 3'-terminal phosphate cyclase-like protein [Populus alba x Populus x berolinensis]